MFTLIALVTSTSIGEYKNLGACQAAIRQIYTQKVDPYNLLPKETVKKIVDIQIKYNSPKEYICIKNK